jgi:arylformamidase
VNPGKFRIIDISRPLSERTPVWPGDSPFRLEWVERIPGFPVNLSAIHMSPHQATHTDAPFHVRDGAPHSGDLDLAAYIGPAQVIEVRPGADGLITPEALEGVDPAAGPRLLFRTGTYPETERWPSGFASLSPGTARLLVQNHVVLVGMDTPSVDPEDSKDLPVHQILVDGGVRWIENLDLSGAAPGIHWLAAQPIRIQGADGAPLRAVLIDFSG